MGDSFLSLPRPCSTDLATRVVLGVGVPSLPTQACSYCCFGDRPDEITEKTRPGAGKTLRRISEYLEILISYGQTSVIVPRATNPHAPGMVQAGSMQKSPISALRV